MFREFLNALMALIFYSAIYVAGTDMYSYFKTEALKSSQKGLGSMQKFNRQLTLKRFDWEIDRA